MRMPVSKIRAITASLIGTDVFISNTHSLTGWVAHYDVHKCTQMNALEGMDLHPDRYSMDTSIRQIRTHGGSCRVERYQY